MRYETAVKGVVYPNPLVMSEGESRMNDKNLAAEAQSINVRQLLIGPGQQGPMLAATEGC